MKIVNEPAYTVEMTTTELELFADLVSQATEHEIRSMGYDYDSVKKMYHDHLKPFANRPSMR